MSGTITKRDLTGSTANANGYASASFTPTAGEYLVVVAWGSGTVDTAPTCTASANSMTFTRVENDNHTLAGNDSCAFISDQAVPGSPASMTVTVTFPTDAATGCFVATAGVTGLQAAGASGARQLAITANIGAGGAYSATFAAATLTTNPILGFVGSNGTIQGTAPGITPPSGFTEIDEPVDQATPPAGFEWCSVDSGQTATTYAFTASVATVRANVVFIEFNTTASATASFPAPPVRRRLGFLASRRKRVADIVVALPADRFGRADGALGPNWQTSTTPCSITGQQVVSNAVASAHRWTADTRTDNQFSQATFVGGTFWGPSVQVASLASTPSFSSVAPFYSFRQNGAGGGCAIIEKIAASGSNTTLASSATRNFAAGEVIRLEYNSGVLYGMINGLIILTAVPSSQITGRRGVGFTFGTTTSVALLDDWSGGDVAAIGGPAPRHPPRRVARPALLRVRRRRVEATPPQVVVAPPSAKVSDVPRPFLGFLNSRRRRSAVRVANPKTATLTDDFNFFDSAKWSVVGLPVVTGGQLRIPIDGNDNYFLTRAQYDLTGSQVAVEFAQVPDQTGTLSLLAVENGLFGDGPQIQWADGNLLMRYTSAGGGTLDDTTLPYDPVAHRWVRIRESAGTVFWDTAPDGATWTNRRSKVAIVDHSNAVVYFYANASGAPPRDAIFDNVNLGPSTTGPVLSGPARRVVRPQVARRRVRVEVTPTQAVVTSPPAKVSDPRRVVRRFLQLPRRDRSVEIVPPQALPPPETVRRRGARGFVNRRRRSVEVTPPQVVVTPPAAKVSDAQRAVRRFVMLPRRARSVEIVPPQGAPAPETARRRQARGFMPRRRGRVEVVPPQIVVTPPTYAPDTRRRVARGFANRRRRSVEVTPPQIVVAPPPTVPDTRRRATRGFASLRRRRVEVTPPQVVVTPPAYVPTTPAKHSLRGVTRRGRHVVVVPAQQAAPTPPPLVPGIPPKRVLRGVPRRGRQASTPHGQAHPAHRGQARRPLRGFARRVGHAVGAVVAAIVTPPSGPYIELGIPVRLGTLEIPDVERTLDIPADTRTLDIPSADRALTIPAVATLTIQIPEVMMADYRVVQKQTASLTYIGNCANRLTKAYPSQSVTIASAALASITGGPVISAVSGSGTTFTFHAVTSAATPATTPEPLLTINLTLSNGDIDPIEITIGVVT